MVHPRLGPHLRDGRALLVEATMASSPRRTLVEALLRNGLRIRQLWLEAPVFPHPPSVAFRAPRWAELDTLILEQDRLIIALAEGDETSEPAIRLEAEGCAEHLFENYLAAHGLLAEQAPEPWPELPQGVLDNELKHSVGRMDALRDRETGP